MASPLSIRTLLLTPVASAALFLLIFGAAAYVEITVTAKHDAERRAELAAGVTAAQVSKLMTLLGGALEQIATDPSLDTALLGADPFEIHEIEARLTRSLPGALAVRLLPYSVAKLDETRKPRMGYADLDLLRQAKTAPPEPAVHAFRTDDAHIALVRGLPSGKGALLASFSTRLLEPALGDDPDLGAVELRQQNLALEGSGTNDLRQHPPSGERSIPGTPWMVAYWTPVPSETKGLPLLAVAITVALLLAGLGFWAARWGRENLLAGHDSVIRLAKDLLSGRLQTDYPAVFSETRSLITSLVQLKRMSNERSPESGQDAQSRGLAPLEKIEAKPVQRANADTAAVPPPAAAAQISPTIFRAYDIRGVVGETLTTAGVRLIGRAIGSEARERGESRVAIGRDGRLSSPELAAALASGIQESGCGVIDLGMVPTPVLYFATHVLNTQSGVMVTGSHNPANYNGLKIVIAGETLREDDIQKLRARIEQNTFSSGAGAFERRDLLPDYQERITQDTQLGRDLKIVVDCGNGVAGAIAPALLESLGCEVIRLYCDVDGNFPNHHPDPSKPENLTTLIDTVRRERADLGVAFDGDGDRLGVVDSEGKIIWPDRQLMIFAADVLSREPGADIIFDVKCTRHLPGQIVRNGGRPLMWKTGHSLIKAKIKETGALLAGEMSGHIFFKERWFGFDDAIYACARLVEILSGDPRGTAEVFAELPDSVNTPELNITLAEGENFRFIEKLKATAEFPDARVTDIDGLRVDFADGFGLVRASNTTPSLVIRFEADTVAALARIQTTFAKLMRQVKSDIVLPF